MASIAARVNYVEFHLRIRRELCWVAKCIRWCSSGDLGIGQRKPYAEEHQDSKELHRTE